MAKSDTPMHTEQPGSRQAGNLLEAMARAAYDRDIGISTWNDKWDKLRKDDQYPFIADMAAAMGVLIHRGLVSPQCLELLKEQE